MSEEHPVFEARLRVRYADTDQMRVAHHGSYLNWLETGRVEFLRHAGHRYRDLEESGVLLSVVDLRCRYLKPARYDDELTVRVWVSQVKRLKVKFEYEVLGTEGDLLCRATTLLGSVNPEGRPVPIPDALLTVLRARLKPEPTLPLGA